MGCTIDIASARAGDARQMDGSSAALGVTEAVGGGARGDEVVGGGAILSSEESLACRNIAESSPRNNVWFSTSRTEC